MGQKKKGNKKTNNKTSDVSRGSEITTSTPTSQMSKVLDDRDRKLREEAEKEAQQAMQVAFIKLMNETKCSYSTEDGDQTPVTGDDAVKLKWKWASGLDWNPSNMLLSSWMRLLAAGDYDGMMAEIEKTPVDGLANLLERRETLYNFSALFHVVKGASTTLDESGTGYNAKCKFVDRSKQPKHLQCAVKLMELGANVNARDMLGATPLFFCVMRYRNRVTLKIAKIMIDRGADVNALNRLGETALLQPAIMKRLDCVTFLLSNGIDPSIRDHEGGCVQDMAVMDKDLKEALTASQNKEVSVNETSCTLCGQASKSRCTACLFVRYCSKECQLSDWNKHKKACKETKKKFTQINLVDAAKTEDQIPTDNFIAKVQINEAEDITLYHKAIGAIGTLAPNEPNHVQLSEKVRSNSGLGYFHIVVDKDSNIKINMSDMLSDQDW